MLQNQNQGNSKERCPTIINFFWAQCALKKKSGESIMGGYNSSTQSLVITHIADYIKSYLQKIEEGEYQYTPVVFRFILDSQTEKDSQKYLQEIIHQISLIRKDVFIVIHPAEEFLKKMENKLEGKPLELCKQINNRIQSEEYYNPAFISDISRFFMMFEKFGEKEIEELVKKISERFPEDEERISMIKKFWKDINEENHLRQYIDLDRFASLQDISRIEGNGLLFISTIIPTKESQFIGSQNNNDYYAYYGKQRNIELPFKSIIKKIERNLKYNYIFEIQKYVAEAVEAKDNSKKFGLMISAFVLLSDIILTNKYFNPYDINNPYNMQMLICSSAFGPEIFYQLDDVESKEFSDESMVVGLARSWMPIEDNLRGDQGYINALASFIPVNKFETLLLDPVFRVLIMSYMESESKYFPKDIGVPSSSSMNDYRQKILSILNIASEEFLNTFSPVPIELEIRETFRLKMNGSIPYLETDFDEIQNIREHIVKKMESLKKLAVTIIGKVPFIEFPDPFLNDLGIDRKNFNQIRKNNESFIDNASVELNKFPVPKIISSTKQLGK